LIHTDQFDTGSLAQLNSKAPPKFHSIHFAVFSKIFATSEGLLPRDLRLNRLYRCVTFEVGLATGANVLSSFFLSVLGMRRP
jgi:hypothetical protein